MIYNIPTALPNLPPVWQLFPWAVPISLDQTRFFHYAHSRTSITFFSNLTLSNYLWGPKVSIVSTNSINSMPVAPGLHQECY